MVMKNEITFQTRREFLRRTVLGGALSWTVPTFLANTFSALQAEAADQATQAATGRDATILVVLQMAGGNDGLNTVVPFANDYYHRARPRIGLAESKVLRLNDDVGLHPALTGFKELYDAGRLAVVQGVGYPNPNRSHFRSTEIWQTASDSSAVRALRLAGALLRQHLLGLRPDDWGVHWAPDAAGLRRQAPDGRQPGQPAELPLHGREAGPRPGEMSSTEESFRKLNQPEAEAAENSGGTIGSMSGPVRHTGSVLDFLERTALDAQVSSDKIRGIASRVNNLATYPASQLGNSLKLVAKLIGGGLPTRVFYVSQGGYDTHTNQANTQERLLRDLGDSVKAFVEDMKGQGNLPRVLLMTFSEFGRRVAENANGGTDHGAAAPMFVVGDKVKAGLLGRYPSLAPADLFQGDLKFNVDFRSVYAGVLESWLKTRSEPVLGRQFVPLQIA